MKISIITLLVTVATAIALHLLGVTGGLAIVGNFLAFHFTLALLCTAQTAYEYGIQDGVRKEQEQEAMRVFYLNNNIQRGGIRCDDLKREIARLKNR